MMPLKTTQEEGKKRFFFLQCMASRKRKKYYSSLQGQVDNQSQPSLLTLQSLLLVVDQMPKNPDWSHHHCQLLPTGYTLASVLTKLSCPFLIFIIMSLSHHSCTSYLLDSSHWQTNPLCPPTHLLSCLT